MLELAIFWKSKNNRTTRMKNPSHHRDQDVMLNTDSVTMVNIIFPNPMSTLTNGDDSYCTIVEPIDKDDDSAEGNYRYGDY